MGVSSGLSARFPYAAPRPGDPAFQQPQVQGSTGTGTQALAIFCTLIVAAPAIVLGILWLIAAGVPLNWVALVVGVLAGSSRCSSGSGREASFDRGSPELLAFTMRH